MKLSEVFQLALDNHYVADDYGVEKGSTYMCHALDRLKWYNVGISSGLISQAQNHIEDLLRPSHCIALHTHLCRTSSLYKSYTARWGFSSKACFNQRVKFWNNVISDLQEKGL